MKFGFIILLIGCLLAGGLWWINKNESKDIFVLNPSFQSPTPHFNNEGKKKIAFKNEEFEYSFFEVENVNLLKLLPNYENQESSETLRSIHKCERGINGGFYDTNNRALGLVVSDYETVFSYRQNNLFNGFVSIKGKDFQIGREYIDEPQFALQTGPLLIVDSAVVNLRLARDSRARRMVALETNSGKPLFLAIYSGTGSTDGPLLDDLPDVVKAFADKENKLISNAINLDGGAAAAFFTPESEISEWTPVGSLWCVTK